MNHSLEILTVIQNFHSYQNASASTKDPHVLGRCNPGLWRYHVSSSPLLLAYTNLKLCKYYRKVSRDDLPELDSSHVKNAIWRKYCECNAKDESKSTLAIPATHLISFLFHIRMFQTSHPGGRKTIEKCRRTLWKAAKKANWITLSCRTDPCSIRTGTGRR